MPASFSFARLPFGVLGGSIPTLRGRCDHTGGPWEQQDGHVGGPNIGQKYRRFVDVLGFLIIRSGIFGV